MESLVGRRLGKYELTAMIGGGGMATVYQARHPGLGQQVAVKILHPFLSADTSFIDRFRREAHAVAALRHPNIVRVLDFDHEDEIYYMVMEYVGGPTLSSVISSRKAAGGLSLPEIRRIFPPLCSAVDYAAGRGMIHRDIKPANIIMSEDGEPILTDYGIAKMIGSTALTSPGTVVGSAHYMSPEQAQGYECDVRSDLYSLGIVLFEALSGTVPFDGDTTVTVLLKHISSPIPSIRALRPNLPPALEMMLARALAKQPQDRYEMGDSFADELLAALRPTKTMKVVGEPVVTAAASAAAAPAPTPAQPGEPEPMPPVPVAATPIVPPPRLDEPAESVDGLSEVGVTPPAVPPPPDTPAPTSFPGPERATRVEMTRAEKPVAPVATVAAAEDQEPVIRAAAPPVAPVPAPVFLAPEPAPFAYADETAAPGVTAAAGSLSAGAPAPAVAPPVAPVTAVETAASVIAADAAAAVGASWPPASPVAPPSAYAPIDTVETADVAGMGWAGTPPQPAPAPTPYPLAAPRSQPGRRNRMWLIIAAVALVVIAAGAVGTWLALKSDEDGSSLSSTTTALSTTTTAQPSTTSSVSTTTSTLSTTTTQPTTTTIATTTTAATTTTTAQPTTTVRRTTTTARPTTTTARPTTTATSPPDTIGPGTTSPPDTIGPG